MLLFHKTKFLSILKNIWYFGINNILSIAKETPFEDISVESFFDGPNPYDRPAANQKKIAASALEFVAFDETCTQTGSAPLITPQGLKATKVINRGVDDATLFTGDEKIMMTISFFVSFFLICGKYAFLICGKYAFLMCGKTLF